MQMIIVYRTNARSIMLSGYVCCDCFALAAFANFSKLDSLVLGRVLCTGTWCFVVEDW